MLIPFVNCANTNSNHFSLVLYYPPSQLSTKKDIFSIVSNIIKLFALTLLIIINIID